MSVYQSSFRLQSVQLLPAGLGGGRRGEEETGLGGEEEKVGGGGKRGRHK